MRGTTAFVSSTLALAITALACGGGSSGAGTSPPGGDDSGAKSDDSGANGGDSSTGDSSSPADGGGSADGAKGGGGSAGAQLANKLRGKANFLVGMGNDLANDHNQDGAYTLGTTLDLHYAYMVGLPTMGGWPDWNANGSFVNILADSAAAHGVTPMYTLYAMAAWGDGNTSVITDDTFMSLYWQGATLLFQRIAMSGKPAVVHLEPDFWGYAVQLPGDATHPAHVKAHAPECANVTDDVAGIGQCLVTLARKYAPNAVIGFHVSAWGADATKTIAFFKAIGATQADYLATDMLDRDAGCFEAHVDPNCQRGGTTGWYWDESNQTSPNFHEHLAWVTQITQGLGLPMMWWQVPFGVPSTTPGGTAGHYRDDRVHYMFGHMDELVAAGGFAAAFGTGAGNQTYITTDGDQFKNAVAAYFASPTPLP